MSDKFTLIESIVNENAVDFREIVNKVLLEKLATKLDDQYKVAAKNMFVLSEEEEVEEELESEEEETEEETEEEMEEAPEQAPAPGGSRVRQSYGSY